MIEGMVLHNGLPGNSNLVTSWQMETVLKINYEMTK